jgi:hypothetical protein
MASLFNGRAPSLTPGNPSRALAVLVFTVVEVVVPPPRGSPLIFSYRPRIAQIEDDEEDGEEIDPGIVDLGSYPGTLE